MVRGPGVNMGLKKVFFLCIAIKRVEVPQSCCFDFRLSLVFTMLGAESKRKCRKAKNNTNPFFQNSEIPKTHYS